MNFLRRLDFPTAESPMRMILNWKSKMGSTMTLLSWSRGSGDREPDSPPLFLLSSEGGVAEEAGEVPLKVPLLPLLPLEVVATGWLVWVLQLPLPPLGVAHIQDISRPTTTALPPQCSLPAVSLHCLSFLIDITGEITQSVPPDF